MIPSPEKTFTQATGLEFRYANNAAETGDIAFSFVHPSACQIVGRILPLTTLTAPTRPPVADELAIILLPTTSACDPSHKEAANTWLSAAPSLGTATSLRSGEIHVQWRHSRAILAVPAGLALRAIECLVDFFHHETALRHVENAITGNWTTVESDTSLAYVITRQDLKNDREIGLRMQAVLQTQLRLSRIEPGVLRPAPHLPAIVSPLGASLRAAALCPERLETAVGQIETQGYLYELASQRLGEHRHARQGFILETIIIILLAAEVWLMNNLT